MFPSQKINPWATEPRHVKSGTRLPSKQRGTFCVSKEILSFCSGL